MSALRSNNPASQESALSRPAEVDQELTGGHNRLSKIHFVIKQKVGHSPADSGAFAAVR